MSAPASASPAVVHNSGGRPPHRAQSTSVRSTAAAPPGSPHRSLSHSQGHSRSNSGPQAHLQNVAKRDFEQSNVARPSSSRRSESRDRASQTGQRSSSRSRHARYASEASATGAPTNGAASEANPRPAPPANNTSGRRRTTITAQTGTWALGKTVGAGSMGKVAVKIVPRQSTDEHRNQADRERADHSKEVRTAREAAIMTLANHPYICGMRDVVRTHYHWYMLCEYVNGGQMLDYIISHGRLKEKQARKFARQIASALDYCHRNSIVHRDLKIENILISKTGDIKIIDFGLSNLFSPRSQLKTFCGSLYFAAPELLQAKQYTGPEVDVWSFGIVLYVLVCGKVPFDDQSMPQLHAKIKKGHVEYPPWLTAECKNLISRMLVTDPKQRAGLPEIMTHPWITKGFNSPPENFLPPREPLQLPLDPQVIEKMTGFDFGTPEYITAQLTKIIQSEEYQNAVRLSAQRVQDKTPETERKRGVFDFYKRRNSMSRDTLTGPSSEALAVGNDPVNAFSPLISVYFLVKEKHERERKEENPGGLSMPKVPGDKPFKMPELSAPEAAYTNASSYEYAGEKPTGGRSRPRARTHGEDEVTEGLQKVNLQVPTPAAASPGLLTPPNEPAPVKKESTAAGILRRFSTRRRHDHHDRDKSQPPPLPPAINEPKTSTGGSMLRSFSTRRARDRSADAPPVTRRPVEVPAEQPELLAPPSPGMPQSSKFKGLGRSASVNSAEFRRRMMNRRAAASEGNQEPPPTSGSDKSSVSAPRTHAAPDTASEELALSSQSRAPTSRAKSLGHARRESIQARRARREQARDDYVPEETEREVAEANDSAGETRSPETIKPVYLKGLFSVSTTSSKPLTVIRADIIRVLKQLGVQYWESRSGFSCRHSPSIDMDNAESSAPPMSPNQTSNSAIGHRRKISFGLRGPEQRERDDFREAHRSPTTPKSTRAPRRPDNSYTSAEDSEESDVADAEGMPRARAAGETTTHVQSDMGGSLVLKFEIFIVKVPLLSLHGIQFKKVDGGTWQYKDVAQKILNELRL
ncbi:Serine/threonine-protein kinase [Neofusicoccum ribis]|uniref:non-specific serine/threonine protein kinase n=1 Tax=Neofusicoccum ribis TaxID=45134 RepID=A0ABR3T6J3_9PEZI